MTFDELYEAILLRRAVDIVRLRGGELNLIAGNEGAYWEAAVRGFPTSTYEFSDLTALLRDLGAEVPERPSAERVAQLGSWASSAGWRVLREHFAPDREPLTVIALLSGGES